MRHVVSAFLVDPVLMLLYVSALVSFHSVFYLHACSSWRILASFTSGFFSSLVVFFLFIYPPTYA